MLARQVLRAQDIRSHDETMSLRLVHVVGARPQFVKYHGLETALANIKGVDSRLVHTGQHYDYGMSKVFFDQLGLKTPDHHLEVGSGTPGQQTGLALERVEAALQSERPDAVVVYGDTNSTLAGALAAAKLHIPVAHVEAGLRSKNKRMPEEVNRILTDHVSTLLFCPSAAAAANLAREGFPTTNRGRPSIDIPRVVISGDIMYDVLLRSLRFAEPQSSVLETLNLARRGYEVLTLHRAESTDQAADLARLIRFVNAATTDTPTVVFPIHPRTRKAYANASERFSDRVQIIEPLSYFDFLVLLKNASRLLTDSGGLQKEAYWLRVPCITLREETEWNETVSSGWNTLYRNFSPTHNEAKTVDTNAYGDGKAADRIAAELVAAFERVGEAHGEQEPDRRDGRADTTTTAGPR